MGASRHRVQPCAAPLRTRAAGRWAGCRSGGRIAPRNPLVRLERQTFRHARAERGMQRADGTTYATIDLTEAEYRSFYVGFANGALWPLLHFRLGLVEFRREDYEGYRAVNRRFAASLARLLRKDDLVWVHDYHLFPLAEELRRLGVRNRIGFFLHTPFVPPALLHALPRAAELLRAMCAFDVVGFHTQTYRRAFLDCVREILPVTRLGDGGFMFEGRHVLSIVDPIGIDAASFADTAAAPITVSKRCGCEKAWAVARSPSASIGSTIPRGWSIGSRHSAGCWRNIPSTAGRSASCRSRRGRARSPAAISVCGASSIASSATPTAGIPNSTGCRCAI